MAEQKTEDSKSPLARRSARPFVGPAGGSAPARPFFKPQVPPTRVATTPFTPPAAPQPPALGTPVLSVPPPPPVVLPEPTFVAKQPTPATALPPIEPVASDASSAIDESPSEPASFAIEAVLPVAPLRPTTPAQTFDITVPESITASEPTRSSVEPDAIAPEHWSAAVTPTYTPSFQNAIDSVPPVEEVISSIPPEPESFDASEPPVTRPITTEMVAIDAFEAFESVWDPTPQVEPSLPDEPAAASPLDANSLGSGIDAQHMWGEEITQDTGDYRAAYEPSAEPSPANPAEPEPIEPGWASHTTPELAMPAWLADDAPAEAEVSDDVTSGLPIAEDLPPASHEATTSSIVGSVPTGTSWSEPQLAAYAAFVTSPEGMPAIAQLSAFANDKQARGLQISAALERLAERIRDGEIDVSSVAPEAPEAAMLASVLAALLGGSKSR